MKDQQTPPVTAHPQLLQPASFELLLNGAPFLVVREQLLFWDQESSKYVLTSISDDGHYTETDYYRLPEGAPFQLINAKLIFMPAPIPDHQDALVKITTLLNLHTWQNKLGKVYVAPTDVRLNKHNVVQPDILFVSIARKSIITEKRIDGAPDFVVEILSPGTEQRDRTEKMTVYGQYDVVEYWIVHLENREIEVYHNTDKTMHLVQTAGNGDSITSKAIEGFTLDVARVFEEGL